MYRRNSKGLKTDPCGSPQVILEIRDAKPLIGINSLRSTKHDSNRLFSNPRIP